MTIYVSLAVALIGVLMYLLCADPRRQEIGKILLFSGALAFLLRLGPQSFTAFR
jgi:hypothetical protein